MTRRAVHHPDTQGDGLLIDLRAAPLWGFLRSLQSEHPGRVALVDLDEDERSVRALCAAAEGDEPQVAIRHGQIFRRLLSPLGSMRRTRATASGPKGRF